MNISIFGLGYVGCVSTGCLAQLGHTIFGVDISQHKVDLINQGKPTIIEKDIDRIIREQHQKGNISATIDYSEAVKNTEVSFICVGTPSLETGQLNLDYVFNTARQIADGLRGKRHFHVVAVRSTVFPGTNEQVTKIIEDFSGKKRNKDFAVISNPEFLREGSAVEDYYNPAITLMGSDNEKATSIIREVYTGISAPFVETDIKTAEIIKYVNNAFHALKITFANEVGNICKKIGVDAYKTMELFKMDKRLNISPVYFNPGMAYGGSCLPKDLKGLSTIAHDNYIDTPVISAIAQSNQFQKERAFRLIQKENAEKIGLLGLAFKKGTDDLRYSPYVELVENLIGKGYYVKIFDKYVVLSSLTGTNKYFIEKHLPHIANLLTDNFKDLIRHTDVIVIAHKPEPEEYEALKEYQGKIIDLVRIDRKVLSNENYEGLSW
jgi:GDP-mannose 6-dehydrogenase